MMNRIARRGVGGFLPGRSPTGITKSISLVITPVGWRQTKCGPTINHGSLLGLASSAPTYRRNWLNLCGFGHMVCDELYGINSTMAPFFIKVSIVPSPLMSA